MLCSNFNMMYFFLFFFTFYVNKFLSSELISFIEFYIIKFSLYYKNINYFSRFSLFVDIDIIMFPVITYWIDPEIASEWSNCV